MMAEVRIFVKDRDVRAVETREALPALSRYARGVESAKESNAMTSTTTTSCLRPCCGSTRRHCALLSAQRDWSEHHETY